MRLIICEFTFHKCLYTGFSTLIKTKNPLLPYLFLQLKVFQPFFVSMDLPYSVIRGEQVAIKVLVFNYLDEEMEVFKNSKVEKKKTSQS